MIENLFAMVTALLLCGLVLVGFLLMVTANKLDEYMARRRGGRMTDQ